MSRPGKIFEFNHKPKKGMLLLAEPFMYDPNFKRTVILLTESRKKTGSAGFIINRPLDVFLDQIIPEIIIPNIPLFSGGPVQADSLHYIHKAGDIIEESTRIFKNVYCGGNFENVINLVNTGLLNESNIKFFVGYSGWEAEQIDQEIKEKTWIITKSKSADVFNSDYEKLWKNVLVELGGSFKEIANYPEDPAWN